MLEQQASAPPRGFKPVGNWLAGGKGQLKGVWSSAQIPYTGCGALGLLASAVILPINGGLPRMASDQKILGARSKNTPMPPRMLSLPFLVGSQAKLRRGPKYAIPWFGVTLFTIPTEA